MSGDAVTEVKQLSRKASRSMKVCSPACVLVFQNFQGNEAMFEAVEQQDMDAVQILLYQYTPEELDLNTPNSEGLTPLDIAIMTNNVPIARILLRTGARESPHCK